MVGADEFEIADGELVEAHKPLLFDAAQGGDVLDVVVLREFEVGEHGTGGGDSRVEVVDAESFEVFHAKVFQHAGACRGVGKRPVFEFKHEVARPEEVGEFAF